MACQIQTDKYTSVVLNLIKLDPSVYSNFDNASKFILSSALTPEQKMMSLHNMAYIYKGLAGIDNKFYNPGNAEGIISNVVRMDDPVSYVSNVSELLGLKKPSSLKVESISKAVDKLATKKNITRQDLISSEGILTSVKNYFSVTVFSTNEEREQLLNEFSTAIKSAILEHDSPQAHKDFLIKQVDEAINTLRKSSSFIPLSDIANLADLNNVLITLTNGQMVEGVRQGEQFKVITTDGSLETVESSQILAAKDARVADNSKSNAGEQVFQEHTLLSSFSIKAVDSADQFELEKKLSNMKNPQAGIKIHAVKLSEVADRRVERIQEAAKQNPKYSSLENREHETFENATQIKALQSSSAKKIMTVSRPKASEQQFVLVGEIIGSGEKFYMYSSDNFVFVSSDNTTERVDFTNPEHMELVKSLAVKNTKEGNKSLSDTDIMAMSESNKLFQGFKASLSDKVASSSDNSLDVTSEFFNAYEASSKRTDITKKQLLKNEIEVDTTLSKPLTVVTMVDGVIANTEVVSVPFIYTKVKNDPYILKPFLAKGQLIQLENGATVSQEVYASDVLGVNPSEIQGKIVKPEHGNQLNILLRFNNDGTIGYRSIAPVLQMSQQVEFAKFIVSLANILQTSANRTGDIRNFDRNSYGFKFYNKAKQGPNDDNRAPLRVNFATSKAGQLQIEIRPMDKQGPYGFIAETENKNQFNFPVNEAIITKLAGALLGKGTLVNQVKEAYPALKTLDLTNTKDLVTFYEQVNKLSNSETALPVLKQLSDSIQKAQKEFAEYLVNNIVNKLAERTTMFPEFVEQLKKDFTFNGVYRPELLVADTDESGVLYPRIEYAQPAERKEYREDLANFKILQANSKKFTVVPKAATAQVTKSQEVLAPIVESEKIHKQEPLNTVEDDVTDIPDIEVFSLVEDENVIVETDEQRLVASEWLSQSLPQFEIDNASLADIIDLAKLDGTVLGAFKDRVIYLNNALKGQGVIYHEAFHGVFRFLMSSTERQNLISAITDNKKHASKFTEGALKDFARQRNYVYNKEEMTRLQAEEILADGFQNYMLKNTKPKGLLGQFMAMLKKLLAMFASKGAYIDNVYGKIKNGQYRNKVISSGIYEGQIAYELIPGLKQVVSTPAGVGQRTSVLSKADQDQLVNMLAGYVIEDGQKEAFSTKFDRIAQLVLDYEYNMDVLLRTNSELFKSNPGLKEKVIKTMGPLYANYRFMLGARVKGESLYDLNTTDNPSYDNRFNKNNSVKVYGEEDLQDNHLGQVSYEMLKKQVKEQVDKVNSILDGSEKTSDKDVIEKELAGANENTIANDDAEDQQETSESSDFDASFNEINALDSLPRQIRKFLAVVRYDQVHPTLGIKVPRMIAGEQLFGSLIKISAEMDPKNIIEHIKIVAQQQIEDGYFNAGNDLMAVYDKLSRYTKMDESGIPQSNKQLYNMIVDVLHKTEIDYVMIDVKTTQTFLEGDEILTDTRNFTLVDKVHSQDVNNKKRNLVTSIIEMYKENKNNPEYLAAVNKLLQLSRTIKTSSFILSDVTSQNAKLESVTSELQKAFEDVGMKFPKSLIRMSIMAIDQVDNKATLNITGTPLAHYNNHSKFISEKKYLEKDFFTDVINIFEKISVNKISSNDFAILLDEKNSKSDTVNRFNSIIKKAAEYIVKYDPNELPSTVRNAEGKPIYRYVSYTPATIIAQSIRTKGLLETLKEDPFYADFLETFYADNAMLGDLLKGLDTQKAREMKLFMDNFKVSLFGGVSQTIGEKQKEGKSFKNIDEKSLYITNILTFLQRTTETSFKQELDENSKVKDVATKIQTYIRSFSQLEASQTNFLVTALYNQFADSKGLVMNADKRLKIVDTLEAVVKQEYNRIAKEWARHGENKTNFDNAESNKIINKYNGQLDINDKSKAATDSSSLRAYKFNKIADFFGANPELESNETKTGLADYAKEGIAFEDLDPEVKDALLDTLENYAKEQLNKHATKLIDLGILQKATQKQRNSKGDVITRGVGGAEADALVYYTSTLIPSVLKVDSAPAVSIDGLYQKTKENYNEAGFKINPSTDLRGLIADAYFNNWMNALQFNEIIDGDIAMNVKDATDYFKRNKKLLAGGSTMKEGYHKVAYLNTIEGYINKSYPQYGPYYSKEEVVNDESIESDAVREKILKEYGSSMYEIFDGQSISSLMHQIDMHESMGRLSPEILHSLIAKHYRELSETEIRVMEAGKVVNNPKKTVTAARNSYHKQSENYIDRNDVSVLTPKAGQKTKDAYDALHALYMDIYSLRGQRQDLVLAGELGALTDIDNAITKNVEEIHTYFKPLPHRQILHNILNAMEYHQVDQVMDTTASKNATMLPVDYATEAERISGTDSYINLAMSSLSVDNKFKFLQVETSGVKDKAKFSVQSKALIAADLINLAEIARVSGLDITASEQKAIDNIASVLENYQSTLKEIGVSNLANLKTVLRRDGDFEVGKIFTLIRTSLEEQGAPTATLKLFDVDASGKPVHSANLPGVRNMLEYYFFSQYSKNVTDEKGSGFKNIHISSFGYNVLEDENGNVITTEQYRKNPSAYPNVRSRPLGVTIEEVNGVKTYFVEAIMPKPLFKSAAHKRFYMENLIKMFGVRIPTEDKRSMIAIKVVDFIDSSNLNGVIVPHFVHLLAGSDFDVDALYGQTFAHYFDFSGNPKLYGEYQDGKNTNLNKFAEFVQYMGKDADLKALIKKETKGLLENTSYEMTEEALSILYHSGFDESDYNGAINFAELKESYESIDKDIEELVEIRNEARDEFVDAIRRNEVNPSDRNALQDRRELGKEVFEYNEELGEKRNQINEYGREISRAKRFSYAGLKVTAILQAFSKLGLPVNAEAFEANPNYALSVRPIFQNKNLQSKLDIISNEAVHKFLYIHERSSSQRFEDILESFGINLEDFSTKYNMYTTDGVVSTKVGNAMNKDGIGITANINKFLALASQYGLELKSENVIWAFKNADLEQVSLNKFGTLNAEDQRIIALIGNILGMFADGSKKPIPAALQMNEVNAGVTLAMIGVGVSPEFAIGFNFIPEIKKAVQSVQSTKYAISESMATAYKFLNNEVAEQIKILATDNKDALANLISAGLISPRSNPYNIIINKDKLLIDFKARALDQKAVLSNTLSSTDIGYKVSAIVESKSEENAAEKILNRVELSEVEQKMILLQLYKEQAQQTFEIKRAGSLIDLFKKLNPSFVNFDKLLTNVRNLQAGESIFIKDTTDKIFKDNQVWPQLLEAIEDLNTQSSKIFLERTEFFAPIKKAFESVFTDQANIAKIITSFVALRKYQMSMPGSRVTGTAMDTLIQEDDQNLIQSFTPEFWFTNDLAGELEDMQKRYPQNKFLQLLRPDISDNKVFLKSGGYLNERSLKMINKSKISGKLADEVSDDADFLLRNENMFMKKLFYHELAKTGMQYKSGSFLQYMNPEMQLDLSGYIETFISKLEETKGDRYKLISAIQEFLGKEVTEKEVYDLFDELFVQMAQAASVEVGNTKIKVADSLSLNNMSNIMTSLQFEEGTKDRERRAVAREVISRVTGQLTEGDAMRVRLVDIIDKKPVEILDLNMDLPKDITQASKKTVDEIGKKLGIRYDIIDELYQFPLMISIGRSKYLLQGVDDEIGNNSFGKTVISSIVGRGEYISKGMSARYALIPSQLTAGTLSPIGFTKENTKKYMDYVSGKQKIEYIAPKIKKSEESVAKLPESGEKQTQESATKSQLQIDMDNLNLTDEVVNSLYLESSKRMAQDVFKLEAEGMIANLRATMSNEQIIDKIKCL